MLIQRAAERSIESSWSLPLSVLPNTSSSADIASSTQHDGSNGFVLVLIATVENQTSKVQQSNHDGIFTFEIRFTMLRAAVTTFIVAMLIMFTVFGNSLVLLSILIDRRLQSISNYLIFSLAVSDLLVAIVVMPIALINEISTHWFLGALVCDIWICSDVICCTSSILHLVAIALDRYWSITNVNYAHARSKTRVIGMILTIWIISAMISVPPLLGWREPGNDPLQTGVCRISQDPGYTIYSTLGAFYVPLVIMVVMYVRIYFAARKRIRNAGLRRRKAVVNSQIMLVLTEPSVTLGGAVNSRVTPTGHEISLFAISSNDGDDPASSVGAETSLTEETPQQTASANSDAIGGISSSNATTTTTTTNDSIELVDARSKDSQEQLHIQPEQQLQSPKTNTGRVEHSSRTGISVTVAPETLEQLMQRRSFSNNSSSASFTNSRRKSVQWESPYISYNEPAVSGRRRKASASALSIVSRDLHYAMRKKPRGSLSSMHSQVSASSSYKLDPTGEQPRRFDKVRHEHKRQSRAIRTVLVITCVFVLCWASFFCYALLSPLCSSCYFPPELVSVFNWLGYSNSFCNFVIYSIFSPEFRRAFRNLFCSTVPNYHDGHSIIRRC